MGAKCSENFRILRVFSWLEPFPGAFQSQNVMPSMKTWKWCWKMVSFDHHQPEAMSVKLGEIPAGLAEFKTRISRDSEATFTLVYWPWVYCSTCQHTMHGLTAVALWSGLFSSVSRQHQHWKSMIRYRHYFRVFFHYRSARSVGRTSDTWLLMSTETKKQCGLSSDLHNQNFCFCLLVLGCKPYAPYQC